MTLAIARKIRRPVAVCHAMFKMLSEYAKLGETTKRGGITVCPPAMARGVGLHQLSAGGHDNSGNLRQEDVPNTPERRLAISKLVVMLQNLGGRSYESRTPGHRQYLVVESQKFFFGKSDLAFWCLLAGYDVEKVRAKARAVEAQGLPPTAMRRVKMG